MYSTSTVPGKQQLAEEAGALLRPLAHPRVPDLHSSQLPLDQEVDVSQVNGVMIVRQLGSKGLENLSSVPEIVSPSFYFSLLGISKIAPVSKVIPCQRSMIQIQGQLQNRQRHLACYKCSEVMNLFWWGLEVIPWKRYSARSRRVIGFGHHGWEVVLLTPARLDEEQLGLAH